MPQSRRHCTGVERVPSRRSGELRKGWTDDPPHPGAVGATVQAQGASGHHESAPLPMCRQPRGNVRLAARVALETTAANQIPEVS